MKKVLYAIMTLMALTSCTDSYNITGTSNVSNLDGRMLYLKVLKDNEFKAIDSCDVVHGQFHFSGSIDTVRMANIFMDEESVLPLVIEGGDKHDQAIMNGRDMEVVNTHLSNEAALLSQREDELVTSFVTENFDNVLGPGVFFMVTIGYQYPELTPWIEDIMSKATEHFKNDPYVKDYYKKAQENQQIMNGLREQEPATGNANGQALQTPTNPAPTPNEMAQPSAQ